MANVNAAQIKAFPKRSGTFNLEPRGHQKSTTRNVQIATTNITLTGQKSKGLTYRYHLIITIPYNV
jgi:hypothetical protein